jgi:beta-xylosidase
MGAGCKPTSKFDTSCKTTMLTEADQHQDDGQYIMYYSAALTAFPDKHCIGVALSSIPEGPFQPMGNSPLICPDPSGQGTNVNPSIASAGKGGAIDPSGFKDVDGKHYIVYKVDGNAVGSGGSCGNSNSGQTPTPLMLVAVDADGYTPLGAPIQLLDRMDIDGPLIEAPNLVRSNDGTYSLFFSSNCYTTPQYDVSWATAPALTGPYTRTGPLITTGVNGLTAPGGASIANDGQHMVFHADFGQGRAMFTNRISGGGESIRLNN